MHEIVSFSKEIEFKNMINKITSISLEHTLMLEDNSTIKGDFIVSGTYKMTAASQIENDFSYKIPVDIEVDDKYDLSNLVIDIDDFTYEVIDEEILKVNIDLLLDKLEIKEKVEVREDSCKEENEDEIEAYEDLFMETSDKEELTIPVLEDKIEVMNKDEDIEILDSDIEPLEKEIVEIKTLQPEKEERNDNTIIEDEDDNTMLEFPNNKKIDDSILDEVDNAIEKMNEDSNQEQMNSLKNISDKIASNKENTMNFITSKEETLINTSPKTEKTDSDAPSLFSSFDSAQETYSTYSIYILREGDSIDNVMTKYKTTREKLEEYNDLNDLRIGTKIIIPSTKDE